MDRLASVIDQEEISLVTPDERNHREIAVWMLKKLQEKLQKELSNCTDHQWIENDYITRLRKQIDFWLVVGSLPCENYMVKIALTYYSCFKASFCLYDELSNSSFDGFYSRCFERKEVRSSNL